MNYSPEATNGVRAGKKPAPAGQDLDALCAMARAISEAEDLDAGLYQVLQKAIELTGSNRGAVCVLDHQQSLALRAHLGYDARSLEQLHSKKLMDGIAGAVARTGQPVFIANRHNDPLPASLLLNSRSFKAFACIPLLAAGKTLGTLCLSGRAARNYGERERNDLLSVGQDLGMVLERAVLLDKVQEHSRGLGALSYVTRQLTSTLELQEVLDRTLAIMCRQVGADHGGIALLDAGTGCIVVRSTWGEGSIPLGTSFPLGRGVAGWVVQNEAPFISDDMTRDTAIAGSPALALGCRSIIGLPLKVKDRPLGAVIATSGVPGVFGSDHVRLLLSYASQASLAIENALLYQRARQEASDLAETLKLLSTAEYRFRTLAELVPVGLVEYDCNLQVVRINQAGADIVGYNASEIVGRIGMGFAAPASRSRLQRHVETALKGFGSTYEMEALHRDGRPVPVMVSTVPLRDADGVITGGIAVAVDLTETRKLEAQRSQAERLAVIGHMASVIAHELRNPLSVIVNSSRMLEMCLGGSEVEPKVWSHIQLISMAGASINHITGELLDHVSPRTPTLIPCQIGPIVNEIAAEITVPGDVGLRVELSPDLPLVNGDREMLKQVLRNLLANAIEASPEGGPVDLKVRPVGNYLEIAIKDSGRGIPLETLQRIFEPFFTTKANGIGLGLSVSKEIVEKHGGSLEAKSRPRRGTAMTLRLPILH